MKTITIKSGMKFRYDTEKYPAFKGSILHVIKKHGRGFICRVDDPVCCGSPDFWEKWELETMILIEGKPAEQRNRELINIENANKNLMP